MSGETAWFSFAEGPDARILRVDDSPFARRDDGGYSVYVEITEEWAMRTIAELQRALDGGLPTRLLRDRARL